MSVRSSGYDRIARDTYVTPRWVYDALYSAESWARDAWDCAPVLADFDFLSRPWPYRSIATNPPYDLAAEFIEHSLTFADRIAMLLRVDFASAKTRRPLFAENPHFTAKYELNERIRWENIPQTSSPSENHAWFVWIKGHNGPPKLGWLCRRSS